MIKLEQIPDEVVEVLIATLHGEPGLPYREALAAALNAWPRMYRTDSTLFSPALILPLPQEARDD